MALLHSIISTPRQHRHTALIAVSLLAVVLVFWGAGAHAADDDADVSACSGSSPYYTAVEHENTRSFLDSFKEAIPALKSLWTCDNFCVHPGIHCTAVGLHITLNASALSGSLPELPNNVDGFHVVLSGLTFVGKGERVIGSLPVSWNLLTRLSYLHVGATALSGTLPETWGTSVERRVMTRHSRAPLARPCGNSCFRSIRLGGNHLTGTLPASWSSMKDLQEIWINNNLFTGTLPTEWSSIANLRTLNARHNLLTGTLPPEWSSMPSIREIAIDHNMFCGCVPDTWKQTSGLTIDADTPLWAPDCAVSNSCEKHPTSSSSSAPSASSSSAPSSSSSAPSASSSSAPSSSSSAPSASSSSAPSSSSSLECYGEIPYYSVSEVENTRLFLMSVRESFPALIPLWVCPNFCSWPGIYCAPAGVVMDLSEMQLQGSLPSIGEMCDPSEVVLRVVDFGGAEMSVEVSGTLPENWSGLTRLERLDLSYTGVSGTLPPAWSALSSLEYLNLGYNDLFGTLPYSWGLFPSLREIYLNDNSLSGGIPSSWMHLAGFEVLDLTNNQLEGSLPSLIVSSQRTFGATATEPRLQWKRRS